MKKIFFLMLFLLLIFSCEGIHHVEGTVIDSKTQLPLDNVLIVKKYGNDTIYTDSVGTFKANQQYALGTPVMSVTFTKSGYKTIKKRFRGWKDNPITIIMKPIDSK